MTAERRQEPDRRRRPRGGRRAGDQRGFAPLVVVIEENADARGTAETILAKLRFAVAPVESADRALAAMPSLNPDLVVGSETAIARLRAGLTGARPRLVTTHHGQDADALVEDILQALRAR